jgi:hypothetical protein
VSGGVGVDVPAVVVVGVLGGDSVGVAEAGAVPVALAIAVAVFATGVTVADGVAVAEGLAVGLGVAVGVAVFLAPASNWISSFGRTELPFSRLSKRFEVGEVLSFPITIQPKFVCGESSQRCTSATVSDDEPQT